ncbi:MAG: cell division protein FtsZ [Candidatus Wildermuthbacteria bacterium]|nr:cell division protein FtsZ [Candidatus Wildermuthbacteria bacterium]
MKPARKKPGKTARTKKKPLKKMSAASQQTLSPAQTAAQDAIILDGVHKTKMRVVGVGGGGGNIVAEIAQRVTKADFIAANTDMQALKHVSKTLKTFAFGAELTQGLGCGMSAELGEKAAAAEKEKIKKILEGQDICVFVATLGGGTGSGAVSVFADVAKELKNLTIGIFTMPFAFEGEKRRQIAEAALQRISPLLNAYIVIPNERIFGIIDKKTPLKEALSLVNKRLAATLEGFIETLFLPGLINIDFADVRAVLEGRGRLAFLHSARTGGTSRASEAARSVLANPLSSHGIAGADRVLFNITSDRDLKMQEVAEISRLISEHTAKARIIFGISFDPRFKGAVRVTLFATGCQGYTAHALARERRLAQKPARKAHSKARRKKATLARAESSGQPEEEYPGQTTIEFAKNKDHGKIRRSGLDVKKAVDEEIRELEEREKQWDIPAFLRNKPLS